MNKQQELRDSMTNQTIAAIVVGTLYLSVGRGAFRPMPLLALFKRG